MAGREGRVSAPISETGRLTDPAAGGHGAAGFTLIELVAVMTVLSILALAMVVGTGAGSLLGRDRNNAAASTARAFETAVNTARSHAFHTRRPYALVPRADGWQLLQRDRATDTWQSAGEGAAPALVWVIDGTAHFPVPPPPDTPPRPPVILASDGRSTAFSVEFHVGSDRFRCQTDGWEVLACARP